MTRASPEGATAPGGRRTGTRTLAPRRHRRREREPAETRERPVRAEVVGVGTELLLGQITNTNARWISERLAEIGVDVLYHQVVGDNHQRIVEALRHALSHADVVIVTGGLGPTQDDITRQAGARGAGMGMGPPPARGGG